MDGKPLLLLVLLVFLSLLTLVALVIFLVVARPWIRAVLCGAPISIFSVLGMRLRGSPTDLLIDAYIRLCRASVTTSIGDVEGAYIDNRSRVHTSDDLVDLVKASTTNS